MDAVPSHCGDAARTSVRYHAPMTGRLFVVATPIGNLEDLGHRAARVLGEVAVVACEDTRTSRVLLDRYGVRTPTTSLHAHSQAHEVDALVSRLAAGDDVALISDAGTPLISDPGGALVAAALTAGIEVVPVPGPSAVLAALAGAGLPADRFVFLGFLPRAEADQRELLGPLRALPLALVVYESPHRTRETLAVLARVLGDRAACVARELTKKFETFERGSLGELATRLGEGLRGEIVIVVAPPVLGAAEAEAPADLDADIARLAARGLSASDAARVLAGAHGLSKKEAYRRVLAHKGEGP